MKPGLIASMRGVKMETDGKVLFRHLHSELLEYQTRFVDTSMRGTGLLFLFLGWMLTSDSGRAFIAKSAVGRSAAVSGITIIMIMYLLIATRMTRVMRGLGHEMDALAYLPRSYYDFRVLPKRVTAVVSAITIVPALIAIVFMLSIAK
jgi:hypothetical protein